MRDAVRQQHGLLGELKFGSKARDTSAEDAPKGSYVRSGSIASISRCPP
jgi:hypothetical protein